MTCFIRSRPEHTAATNSYVSRRQQVIKPQVSGVFIVEIRGICGRVSIVLPVFAALDG
jgi:hypothetical protein